MTNVISFDEKKFVKEFVNVYLSHGSEAAGMYAINSKVDFWTENEATVRIRQSIEKEFSDRGFDLVPKEEAEVA